MALECGIVGLPNVGKSTLFNAITSAVNAEAANYPFCTIDPNVGVVEVPDPRLNEITKMVKPQKTIPTTVSFVDIAGLVKGASRGEGLGNKFLGNIKDCHAIAHVLRCFEDDNVIHVDASVDPLRDRDVIETELMLADLDTVERRVERNSKLCRSGDKKAVAYQAILEKVKKELEDGRPLRKLKLEDEELNELFDLHLITLKPVIYVANVDESSLATDGQDNPHFLKLQELAKEEGAEVIPICAKVEAELLELDKGDRAGFLEELGVKEPGLHKLIRSAYTTLGLRTYFTAGEKEVRAWTIQEGWKAPKAAGVIHGDFERGFICSETYHYEDLVKLGSEAKVKEAGLVRTEGKEYVVKDGDILHFRFNV